MATKFSDEVMEALQTASDEGTLNFEKCQELEQLYGEKARALVAAAVRHNLDYKRKQKVSKTGGEVITKTQLVERVASKLGGDSEKLESLEKANKQALEYLDELIAE